MKRPWMPLYIADYLHDTSHLRAAESGAYLHLIMAYWVKGSLPNDDRQLATIAKMTDREWAKARPVVEAFFTPGFTSHKRIDAEIAKSVDISTKRKAAVEQREIKRRSNDGSKPPSLDPTLHTSHFTKKIDDDDQAGAARRLLAEIGEACGFRDARDWPIGWKDAYRRIVSWRERWPDDLIVMSVKSQMAIKDDGPPSTVNYFEKGIAKDAMRRAKPLPTAIVVPIQEVVRVQQSQRPVVGEGIQRLRDRLGPDDAAAPDQAPRPEPDRGVVEILPPCKAE